MGWNRSAWPIRGACLYASIAAAGCACALLLGVVAARASGPPSIQWHVAAGSPNSFHPVAPVDQAAFSLGIQTFMFVRGTAPGSDQESYSIYRASNQLDGWTRLDLPDPSNLTDGQLAIDPHTSLMYLTGGGLNRRGVYASLGDAWSDLTPSISAAGADVTSVAVDPSRSRAVFAGLTQGLKWSPLYTFAPPNGREYCSVPDDRSASGIRMSTDGGASWQDVSQGLPAATVPTDSIRDCDVGNPLPLWVSDIVPVAGGGALAVVHAQSDEQSARGLYNQGRLYRFDPGSRSWSPVAYPESIDNTYSRPVASIEYWSDGGTCFLNCPNWPPSTQPTQPNWVGAHGGPIAVDPARPTPRLPTRTSTPERRCSAARMREPPGAPSTCSPGPQTPTHTHRA
jgi:hypothetical protein